MKFCMCTHWGKMLHIFWVFIFGPYDHVKKGWGKGRGGQIFFQILFQKMYAITDMHIPALPKLLISLLATLPNLSPEHNFYMQCIVLIMTFDMIYYMTMFRKITECPSPQPPRVGVQSTLQVLCKLLFMALPYYSKTSLNRTLSKPDTSLNWTKFLVPNFTFFIYTKLNLSIPDTLYSGHRTPFLVPNGQITFKMNLSKPDKEIQHPRSEM